MPKTRVVFYKEADDSVPILDWLDSLQEKAIDKCTVRIERLQELGHELRIGLQHSNYRILYFFHGNVAAVISHGLLKEDRVPVKEIETAILRKRKFEANPALHTYLKE